MQLDRDFPRSAGNDISAGELCGCANQSDVVEARPQEFAPPPPQQNAPGYTSPPAAMSQAQQPQQSVVPVTIDVVKQLTVYYQAWKENRISEEQLQQLNDMPIDANTGLVWWQWIERQNGIWAHWPPRAKPAFMQDAA
jgi:hypothetical protein